MARIGDGELQSMMEEIRGLEEEEGISSASLNEARLSVKDMSHAGDVDRTGDSIADRKRRKFRRNATADDANIQRELRELRGDVTTPYRMY